MALVRQSQAEDGPALLIKQSGSVLTATLNRQAKANSLNQELIDALDALAAQIEDTHSQPEGPRALIITGSGEKAFSAGADITELMDITAEHAFKQMRRGQAVFDRIERLPIVVIMAINGLAVGGGLELAMAGDLRIARPDARFGQAEISLENLPGWGGTQRLPQLVGRGIATEMILTGQTISAPRAQEVGLINQIAEAPLKQATELAEAIGSRNPTAVSGAKEAIRVGLTDGVTAGLLAEARAVAAACQTPQQRAAVKMFLHRPKDKAINTHDRS